MAEISPAAVGVSETPTDRYVIDGRCKPVHGTRLCDWTAGQDGAQSNHWHSRPQRRDGRSILKNSKPALSASLIKSASLSVQDDISGKDLREMERLMNQEVLETAKFPEILYEASSISVTKMADMLCSATLNGNLTLHGVTRSQPIVLASRIIREYATSVR